jgi:hypothetical protein
MTTRAGLLLWPRFAPRKNAQADLSRIYFGLSLHLPDHAKLRPTEQVVMTTEAVTGLGVRSRAPVERGGMAIFLGALDKEAR